MNNPPARPNVSTSGQPDVALTQGEIQELLTHCLGQKLPVSVVNLASGAMEEGTFSSGYGGALSFHLTAGIKSGAFKRHTPLAISFVVGSLAYAFLTRIVRFDEAAGQQRDYSRLVVDAPSQITHLECRRSVRIPVPKQSSLRVDLATPAGVLNDGRAVDISISGVLVGIPLNVQGLKVDDEVRVTLRHADQKLEINGLVRRRKPDSCGIYFSDCDTDKTLDGQVRRLIARVEREWLRNRQSSARSA
jgi:hypothetical protein